MGGETAQLSDAFGSVRMGYGTIISAVPYPQTVERIREFLPRVYENSEISDDLKRTETRHDVLGAELEARALDIWRSAAEQLSVFNSTEQSKQERERRLPLRPGSLHRLETLASFSYVGLVLAILAAVVFWIWKGWAAVAAFVSTPRFLMGAGLLAACTIALFTWYLLQQSFFRRAYSKATEDLELDIAEEHLKAARALADSAVEQALLSTARDFLESRKQRRFGVELPSSKADGLAQILNSDFEVATGSRVRVRRLVNTMQGASIGVSGPRGAGKTTLLWSLYEAGNIDKDVLSVFTSAPVQYEPRDFILHLFSSVCSRIIEKRIGPEPASQAWQPLPESPPTFLRQVRMLCPALAFLGILLIVLGLTLAQAKMTAATAAAQTPKPPAASPLELYMSALDIKPAPLIEWGFVFVIAGVVLFYLSYRERKSSMRTHSNSFAGFEREPELDTLGKEARRLLSSIRFQQSYTSGWSGSFKFPVALEGGLKREKSWSERQQTLPEIVAKYRAFLGDVTAGDPPPYTKVLICIDELDKLESDEAAEQFLNGIKSVFNQKNCFYLVSVSENAMSNFERRGLHFRDAFDSAFDEIVYVDYLDLKASKGLLGRRVLNVPDPFLCFCHCISGGLPRDLVRICRDLFEFRDLHPDQNQLSLICGSVIGADIESKKRAMAIAAQRLSSDPDSTKFLEIVSFKEPRAEPAEPAVWFEIEKLELLLKTLVSSENQPEDKQKPAALAKEMLVFLYFAVTMLQLFSVIDEQLWLKGEDQGLFDQLAFVRREIARNPAITAASLAAIRSTFGLERAPRVPQERRYPIGDISFPITEQSPRT